LRFLSKINSVLDEIKKTFYFKHHSSASLYGKLFAPPIG